MFISPMLARPRPDHFALVSGEWVAEEKYDGHRLIVEVDDGQTNLFADKKITAWSRYGRERVLPTHILEVLSKYPKGIYDGELLVPGKRSYGVTELANTADLVYFIFDLLVLENEDITELPYYSRRHLLQQFVPRNFHAVQLANAILIDSWEQVVKLRDEIWERDGEGLILKHYNAPYQPGKRSKDFIKVKAVRHATLTVTAFLPSKGTKNNRGLFGMVRLMDEEGNVTTVKTKNDAWLAKLESLVEDPKLVTIDQRGTLGIISHPFIGRTLVIEYQERTPDGSYRHPRWDRWEDE